MNHQGREQWKTKIGFIIAASGSAIGLGNIWRFPYMTGMNGGGAFVVVYLLCIVFIGLPLLITELKIGRMTQRSPIAAFRALKGKKSPSQLMGWLVLVSGFMMLSFYSVVGGWSLEYILKSFLSVFVSKSPQTIYDMFGELYSNPAKNLLWHTCFMLTCMAVVVAGVQRGIERWTEILMGILLVLILVMVGRGLTSPGAAEGIRFVFSPDFSKLTPGAILEALGHAFFTLSLAMGIMITYGSYLDDKADIPRFSFWVATVDTGVALLACLMIFPIVFSYGFEAQAGPGLVFKTLPVVFSQMPMGMFFSTVFFFLLFFAAVTSGISILEPVVRAAMDGLGWQRKTATLILGFSVLLVGVPSALSGSTLASLKLLGERNFFDSVDYLVTNWFFPLGSLAVAIFIGWFMSEKLLQSEFVKGSKVGKYFPVWLFVVRYVSPVGMMLIFLNIVGFFKLF